MRELYRALFRRPFTGRPVAGRRPTVGLTPLEGREVPAAYLVSISGMNVGETSGSNTGELVASSTPVTADSWEGAVAAAVSGSATTGDGQVRSFPGPGFLVGTVADIMSLTSDADLGDFLDPADRVIGFEDWTDGDFDDAYWTVTATEVPVISITKGRDAGEVGTDSGQVQNGTFTLTRTGDPSQPLDVNVTFGPPAGAAGKFATGDDYTATAAHFDTNSSTATITIAPNKDDLVEGDETVLVVLEGGGGYMPDASKSQADLTIADDPPILAVVNVDHTAEGVVSGGVQIVKTGGTDDSMPIVLKLGGTATPGVDYAVPGDPDGDAMDSASQRLLAVPSGPDGLYIPIAALEDDDDAEDDEFITLSMTANTKLVNSNAVGVIANLVAYNVLQVRGRRETEQFERQENFQAGGLTAGQVAQLYAPSDADLAAVGYTRSLTWGRFGQTSNSGVAARSITELHRFLGPVKEVKVSPNTRVNGMVEATYRVTAPVTLDYEFSGTKSWATDALRNQPTTAAGLRVNRALLIHEDGHFQISAYIISAAKYEMTSYSPAIARTGANKAQAEASAINAAKSDYVDHYRAVLRDLRRVADTANEMYDSQTSHGLDGASQAVWTRDFRAICDGIIGESTNWTPRPR